ncbi:MAG: YceI family protein [Urechidicola sp.]|nr:YceI family protein [Urechidicola sp.]
MKFKRNSSTLILSLTFILLSSSFINAQTYVVDNGTAFFKAKVSINSYTGTSDQLNGFINFETGEIEFSIPANSIKTSNKKRDKHMYEIINVEENSTVSFKGNLIDLYDESLKEKQTLKVKGHFTFVGVTLELELEIDLSSELDGLRLHANWTLLITDYNLERPSKAFMTVKDEHQMGVDALLVREN